MDQFKTSSLVKEIHPDGGVVTGKIYATLPSGDDVGTKHHVAVSDSEFTEAGGDHDAIYHINYKEASDDFYVTDHSLTHSHFHPDAQVKGFNVCQVIGGGWPHCH